MDSLPELFNGFSISAITFLLITVLLLFVSTFSSASEVAFFSLNPKELNEEKRNDKAVLKLLSNPEKLLATILIINNFSNIGTIISATYCSHLLFNFASQSPLVGFLFDIIVITFLLLLFGEIMPKIYSIIAAKKIALKGAHILLVLQKILNPVASILINSSNLINKKLIKYNHTNISIDELSDALQLTANQKDEDKDILEGIVNFGNITANKVMTPRLQMVDINIKTPFKELLQLIIDSGYSRIPVYQGNKDNIRGILYIKDILPHLDKGDKFRWQSLVRPAYFVPETKKIDDLLTDFQKNKIHIAIVVDEFGGTSGMITMEDILEEILGEINDEYDENESEYQMINENTYLVEAQISLTDFFRIKNIDQDIFTEISDDAETLAGLILAIKGEIPAEKEIITYKNYSFEIVSADNRKIETVKVTINEKRRTENENLKT